MLELTPDNAEGYLRERGWIGAGPAAIEPLGWGVSNAVLRVRSDGRTFVLKQSRPQLRTRDVWFSDLDRVYREQEVMQVLTSLLPPLTVPEVLFVDRSNYVFAMSHAPAEARVWKEALLAGEVDDAVGRHAGLVLGRIHEATARQPELVEPFRDHTVFVQLRVEPFYRRIQERHPEVSASVELLVERLLGTRAALCHGDYSPKNILTHATGFTLVDYETAHFGDPTMDLGFFLSHLILKALKRPAERQRYFALTKAFLQGYAAEIHTLDISDLLRHGIGHFAVCALARIDGTSPVDYLPEESKRAAIRRLGRGTLHQRPARWEDVLRLCEEQFRFADDSEDNL